MLLTTTQASKINKAFANNSAANITLSKTQLHKIRQSGGFLGRLLGPLLKTGLSLIGNVLKTLTKSVLIPLELTAAASATDAAIHKKIFGSDTNLVLRILNEEMNDFMKIESGLLIKGVTQTIKNETKGQKEGFLGILLATLGASLLGNLLAGKGKIRAGEGTIRAGEKVQLELVKKQLEQIRIFNAASPFHKF